MKEKYNVNVEKKIKLLTFLKEQNLKEIIIAKQSWCYQE
jgi:hypothetical protein